MREKKVYSVSIEKTMVKSIEIKACSQEEARRIVCEAQKAGAICWDEGVDYEGFEVTAEELDEGVVDAVSRYVVVEYVRRGEIRNWWTFDTTEDARLFAKAKHDADLAHSKCEYDHFLKYGFWVGVFMKFCTLTEEGWMPDMDEMRRLTPDEAYDRCVYKVNDGWDRDWTEEEAQG